MTNILFTIEQFCNKSFIIILVIEAYLALTSIRDWAQKLHPVRYDFLNHIWRGVSLPLHFFISLPAHSFDFCSYVSENQPKSVCAGRISGVQKEKRGTKEFYQKYFRYVMNPVLMSSRYIGEDPFVFCQFDTAFTTT